MKKIISTILCAVLIISCVFVLPITTSAAGNQLEIDCGGKTYAVNVGDTFHYTYYMNVTDATKGYDWLGEDTQGYVVNFDFNTRFDRDYLELIYNAKTAKQDMFPNATTGVFYNLTDIEGIFANGSNINDGYKFDTNDSVLINATFTVKKAGKTSINTLIRTMCAYTLDLDRIVSDGVVEKEFYRAEVLDAKEITSKRGDANKDGFVDVLDATCIQKLKAKIVSESEVDLVAADVNLDGQVDILDATRIQKYKGKQCNIDGSTPYDATNPINP